MEINEIAKEIKKHGGTVYLVGGALRDTILGKEQVDEDYCVVGISEEEFTDLFPKAKKRGKSFAVFDIDKKEFALARKEKKTGQGHKNFAVLTNKKITIEEDLKRRDITINSIAQNVLTKEIIDPYNGREDLKNKIIKATSNSFSEDPLRVYRVARLASILEFEVEPRTIKMMSNIREELNTLSKERVFTELKKALKADKPSIFFNVLKEAKVLDVHFPEINDLIGAIQPIKYHPEGDSYNHTMLTVDNSAKLTNDAKIRFCALVHDLGKGRTPKEMYPHHYNHEQRGIEPLKILAKRLGIPNEWKKCSTSAILEHMKGGIFWQMTPAKKVSFLEKADKSLLGLKGLQIIVYCDRCRDINAEEVKDDALNFLTIGKKMIKEVDGEYIKKKYKIKPSKEFGNKLHDERVIWMKERMKNVQNS